MAVLVEVPHHSFKETFPLRAMEWQLATIMTGIGIISLLYPQVFHLNPALQSLLALYPEAAWGWSMAVVGAVGWFALVRNGGWKRSPLVRTVCATLRGLIWVQIFMAFAGADLINWGLIIFVVFTLSEFYNAFRATTDFLKQRKAAATQ